jgi:ACS family D-galactonate transporter-like MFS transporter
MSTVLRDHPNAPARRWTIALLLGMGVLVNYFDRVNLSVSHDALFTTFGLSNIAFGYLSGAYSWTYAACQLPIGVLLDKFGVRRIGRISSFLWGIASFGAAVTPTVGGFFAARFLLGVGEAPTFPANAKAIGVWFPQEERSLATSIFDAAAKLAPAVGVPLIGILLLHAGWRWSFAATGIVSMLYFMLFFFIYREPNEDERSGLAEFETGVAKIDESEQLTLLRLMSKGKVVGLALGSGAYNYTFYLLLTWLPTYLSITLHLDLLHSVLYTSGPWLFATATDIIIGGWLVNHLIRKGWNASKVRQVVLIGGTAMGMGILGAAHAHTALRALIWISISIGGLAAAAPVCWSVPSLIAPRAAVGRVGGIMNLSNQLSGIAAPIITGYIVAATHSFASAFIASATYLAIGVAGYALLLGRIEPWEPTQP